MTKLNRLYATLADVREMVFFAVAAVAVLAMVWRGLH